MSTPPSAAAGADDPTLVTRVTYQIFIIIVTVMALAVTALFYLAPIPEQAREVLFFVNYIASFILLFDVAVRFWRAPNKLKYVLPLGLLDFVGSLPGLPYLRLLRIPSLILSVRRLRNTTSEELLVVARSQLAESTLLMGIAVAFLVATAGGMAIVMVEAPAEGSNIKTGADALWYAIVTISTVGYGDRFPVTLGGRIIGSGMIVVGVGIFSVLTGFISTKFLAKKSSGPAQSAAAGESGPSEVALLRAEIVRWHEEQQARAAADRQALEERLAALQRELDQLPHTVPQGKPQ